MDDLEEIQSYFLEEAADLFESSHKILLEAENNGELIPENIDALFRNIHTLKGGSGSVELNYFAKYVHYLEDFIDNIRQGKLVPTMAMVDFLLQELDTLQEMIDEEANSNLDVAEFEIKLATLLKDIESYNNSSNEDEKLEEKTPMEDKLNKYSGEFIDMYDSVVDALHSVEHSQDFSNEFVGRLFRHLHTLKGSSSFMGLEAFPKYLHNIENLLDQARNGIICYTDEFNHALLDAMLTSEEIANDEFNNSLDNEQFKTQLIDVEELFNSIVENCSKEHREHEDFKELNLHNIEEEDDGFEIFGVDDIPKKDIGFEIFGMDEKPKEDAGFEIFGIEEKPKEDLGFEIFGIDEKPKEDIGFEIFEEKKPEENKSATIKPKENKSQIKKDIVKKANNKTIKKSAASNSIRVGLDKIDFLMNRVGDLVITKSMLYKFLEDLAEKYNDPAIVDRLSRLDREIRELQEAVMSVRMIPMESVYAKLPKTIRDLAKKLDKKVDFIHHGDSVEIDKMMVEGLTDPLVHIIRNSLDHGIESPSQRVKKGKQESGVLTITAAQESGHIIISIKDDGAGINLERVTNKALENSVITNKEAEHMSDEDKAMLIFSAGLSTADAVSDVSGRGVGMDVVMNNITSLGGTISIETKKDKGSKFTILLPLTLAILDGLNVKIGKQELIMPLNMIVESLQPTASMIKKVGSDEKDILMLRNEFIPIIRLYDFFNIVPEFTDITKGMLIITKITNVKVAIFVDSFLNQEQIVVKSLEKNYKRIKGIGAATIRGDGGIGLILDVMNIIEEEKVRSWNS
ncbi:MAG: chemotaxis protein CheA [Campylobacterota bacterium]|nr:chemotaxis protein CheA [Campylobacterota bacterium]